MTVRLTIRTAAWRAHVARVASAIDGLVPVVKGNGYGFGRRDLAALAAELSDLIAIGNVFELNDVPAGTDAVVLTPTLAAPGSVRPILTVGRPEHVDALDGWGGRVLVKIESSMHRYGSPDHAALATRAEQAGLEVVGVSVHLPLDADGVDNRAEIAALLPGIDPRHEVWLSHLDPDSFGALPATHRYRLRLGTRLWLGAPETYQLHAEVLDVRATVKGQPAGYRLAPAADDGHLVMVGAGTANGVTALADGRSPFHFGRQRMPLHEPPHMHSSMCLVAAGRALPAIGDWVDLQRPMTMTAVDDIDWR